MSAHRRIPLEARTDWEQALAGIPHAFAHTWGHCRSVYLSSRLPTYLYCFEDGDVRVVCPLSERRYRGEADIVTPYGFGGFVGSADCPEFPAHWAEYAARAGYVCGYIGLHPLLRNESHYRPAAAQACNSVFVLDLRLPEERLVAGLDANRRRQIRAPLAAGDRIVWDAERLAAFFQAAYPEFVRRIGAAPVYHFAPETLALLCSLERVFLVGAEVEGRLEAVVVFGHTPAVGEYLFGVALPDGRRHAARLLWCGIERLRSLGVPLVNLGGGARPGDGIAEFKRRFGAREVPLTALREVYRPTAFRALCRAAGVDAGGDGYFPPYHAPGLQS
jgi:hypothetical protein